MASGFTLKATEDSSGSLPAIEHNGARASQWLLCRTATRCFAFPAANVSETMRVLPVEPVAGVPPFVLGLSVIRGEPVPVIDTAQLVGERSHSFERFITVRAGGRVTAFAIDCVIGIRAISEQDLEDLPTLLVGNEVIDAIAALDEGLTFFLNAARAIPESVLATLDGKGSADDL